MNARVTWLLVFSAVLAASSAYPDDNSNRTRVSRATNINGCTWTLNDLPQNAPLYVKKTSTKDRNKVYNVRDFWYPELGSRGKFIVRGGTAVKFLCPGDILLPFNKEYKTLTCQKNKWIAKYKKSKKSKALNTSHKFEEIKCKSLPVATAKDTKKTCGPRKDAILLKIGYEVKKNKNFYLLVETCFNKRTYDAIYSKSTLIPEIKFAQISKKVGFTTGTGNTGIYEKHLEPKINSYYNMKEVEEKVMRDLGVDNQHYIQAENTKKFLARGHLSPNGDFVYNSQQRATYFYANVAPQWQIINSGNWEKLERAVREFAEIKKIDLQVYTGTHGIMKLKNGGREVDFYLIEVTPKPSGIRVPGDPSGRRYIKVPAFYWKVVYDPKSNKGVAFVVANNPYEKREVSKISSMCKGHDECSSLKKNWNFNSWNPDNKDQGLVACCNVDHVRKQIQEIRSIIELPSVIGLLN